jgi:hypothetical protein
VHHDPGVAALKSHWETQGWKPFSLPLGIKLDQAHPGHLDLHQVQDLRRLSLPAARPSATRAPSPSSR